MIGAIMIYESKNQNFILLFKFKQCTLCNAVTRPCDVISSLFFHVDWFYVDFINYVGTYRKRRFHSSGLRLHKVNLLEVDN